MQRRHFIKLIGGMAAAWPPMARGQSSARRRIGVIMPLQADDPEVVARLTAFRQALAESGWTAGGNVEIEYRYGTGDPAQNRKNAAELVALAPDLIFSTGTPALEPLLRLTRTLPIVFVQVPDPVGSGMVASLSRPAGNATGFAAFDYGIAGKWLDLLKEIAPDVTRVALVRDPTTTAGIGQWAASQAFASSFRVELSPVSLTDAATIESGIGAFAGPNGGLIVSDSGPSIIHRQQIIGLAERYRLPAVYPQRHFAVSGGLLSYGSDTIEPYRRAASYVDRVLKGEKPGDLPVQMPVKYELVVNLKTAKTIGLTMPQSVLARADEVIE
ncbi:MAG: ABC transporter substrate-binding protein [Xanthobacteraceae bacterium]